MENFVDQTITRAEKHKNEVVTNLGIDDIRNAFVLKFKNHYFQVKNHPFLVKNHHLSVKSRHFLIKNHDF